MSASTVNRELGFTFGNLIDRQYFGYLHKHSTIPASTLEFLCCGIEATLGIMRAGFLRSIAFESGNVYRITFMA